MGTTVGGVLLDWWRIRRVRTTQWQFYFCCSSIWRGESRSISNTLYWVWISSWRLPNQITNQSTMENWLRIVPSSEGNPIIQISVMQNSQHISLPTWLCRGYWC
jgi:hypothetical protein